MEEITKISESAFKRYFTHLSQFGYRSINDVYRLLILSYIEELLDGYYAVPITEREYRIIMKAFYCLAGTSCLVQHPQFSTEDTLIHPTRNYIFIRESELEDTRLSEDEIVRIKA